MSLKFGTIFIMKYEKIVKGIFLSRPNRFIADVFVDGIEAKAHVKNTGRCEELLITGATVYLEDHFGRMGSRKLRYSLIGIEKDTESGSIMVNMDSQAPNKVIKEALESGYLKLQDISSNADDADYAADIKPEARYGDSRLDFKISDSKGRTKYIEVKGVTLESKGIAYFPDAPTERGIKHLKELENALKEGKEAYVIFVIQMKGVKAFKPNDEKHKAFGDALRYAHKMGVKVWAFECDVTAQQISLGKRIEVNL